MNPIANEEARYVLDLIDKRRKKSSTFFCTQYEDTGWYAQLGGDETPVADSIMDQIAMIPIRLTSGQKIKRETVQYVKSMEFVSANASDSL